MKSTIGKAPPSSQQFTRRDAAKMIGGVLFAGLTGQAPLIAARTPVRQAVGESYRLTDADNAFLDDMQRSACLYFTEQIDPASGQVLDRAINKTASGERDPRRVASIAATGFGLTALCIADHRKYLPADQIRKQVLSTLQFHLNKMPHQHGFFFHFSDVKTGTPLPRSEVSPIDTAILLCGILTCRAYFNDPQINGLATEIYNRVEWPWMLNGGDTFALGWYPSYGFIKPRWDHYCELMMMYLLAIGSTSHPISPDYWNKFTRPLMHYGPYAYFSGNDPLFVHQYSHAWFDFAGKRDYYADYFANSVAATRAHKAFCLSLKFGYNENYWGVSASDWQHGYTAWGGPPLLGPVDGSVVPAATAGSLPFLPADCLRVLRSLKEKYGKDAWGRYGPCDAFHPSTLWYDPDVLGIDLGISVIMAENLRTGFVWQTFMKNPEALSAMRLCGFNPIRH
jgi:hypothetical protein